MSSDLAALRQQNAELEAELERYKAEAQTLRSEKQEVDRQREEMDRERQRLEQEHKGEQQRREASERQLQDSMLEKTRHASEVMKLQHALGMSETRVKTLQEQQPPPSSNCGVGMLLGKFDDRIPERAGKIFVLKLVPGSPADVCGQIQTDDVLYRVDGQPVTSWNLDEVFELIKGVSGSPVTLELGRMAGMGESRYRITLHRKEVREVIETHPSLQNNSQRGFTSFTNKQQPLQPANGFGTAQAGLAPAAFRPPSGMYGPSDSMSNLNAQTGPNQGGGSYGGGGPGRDGQPAGEVYGAPQASVFGNWFG